MATLLWIGLGVLLALLSWLVPAGLIAVALVVAALTLIAILLPRDLTAIGARIGIGFGAFFAVIFGRLLVPDPLAASGATYLVAGAGMLILVAGLVGVWRNRRYQRRQRALKAAADLL